jgi:hypothetical protein
VESHEGLQFPDRSEEEETGTPGPAERRIEDRDTAADETPAEERVGVIKKLRTDDAEDEGRE